MVEEYQPIDITKPGKIAVTENVQNTDSLNFICELKPQRFYVFRQWRIGTKSAILKLYLALLIDVEDRRHYKVDLWHY